MPDVEEAKDERHFPASPKLLGTKVRTETRKHCFTPRVVNLWNSLPVHVLVAGYEPRWFATGSELESGPGAARGRWSGPGRRPKGAGQPRQQRHKPGQR